MKAEHRTIIGSFIAGVATWVIDAIQHYSQSPSTPFLEIMFPRVSEPEFLRRIVLLLCFIVFGILISALVARHERAENALMMEQERLRVTLRSIGDAVIATDVEGKVQLVNRVAEALTGWSQEEALGRPLADIFQIISEKTRERCEDPVHRVLREGKVVGLANGTVLVARDGTERVIADSAAPITGKDNNILGVVLVFRDITMEKKMTEELQRAQRLESIGLLAGGLAHDFNNLLTAIWSNITLAKSLTVPGAELYRRLIEAESATSRAQNLTTQLLAFSKRNKPVRKPISMAQLLNDVTCFALSGSNVCCKLQVADDLWAVEADEGQIHQVISNLIINADQAMPEGGTVRVCAENVAVGSGEGLPLPAGKYVRITVQDEGVGIPQEHLSKIFDPYFTTKQKGSGLGLAIGYRIVSQHGGIIDVESQVGAGSTFRVYLPACEKQPQSKPQVTASPPQGKGRIILVDDEDLILEAAGDMLRGLGYEVQTVRDGAAAVELYKQGLDAGRPFDAVIMDLTIPGGMGGREAIIKLIELDPEVTAIVSSGYGNDPAITEYEKYGFSGVVAKPYNIHQLATTLHEVLERKQARMMQSQEVA